MAHKTGAFSVTSAAYREVSTARLRLVCGTPGACLRYYLDHSLRATAGVTAGCGMCELGFRLSATQAMS